MCRFPKMDPGNPGVSLLSQCQNRSARNGAKNWTFVTDEQLNKLDPLIRSVHDTSLFVATYRIYFPFLTCEVKCSAAALDVADRQNAHSITCAIRGVAFPILEKLGAQPRSQGLIPSKLSEFLRTIHSCLSLLQVPSSDIHTREMQIDWSMTRDKQPCGKIGRTSISPRSSRPLYIAPLKLRLELLESFIYRSFKAEEG